jgi:short-subunit dehydrogenase
VLMSSMAGNQGTARIAAYAASKAFNRVLAEGLWEELAPRGIDVIACCAGAVRTPGYANTAGRDAPGTLDADRVAERTLAALGRGPIVIPGFVNRLAAALMGRILPRRAAIRIMAGTTRRLSS